MVVSSWSILSILTAVISENMLNVTHERRENEEKRAVELMEEHKREKLDQIFSKMEVNDDGAVDYAEFQHMLQNDNSTMELIEASGLAREDLSDLFMYLSSPTEAGPPVISRDDFVNGLQRESQPVNERSVFRTEKRINELEATVRDAHKLVHARLDNIDDALSKLLPGVETIVKKTVDHHLRSMWRPCPSSVQKGIKSTASGSIDLDQIYIPGGEAKHPRSASSGSRLLASGMSQDKLQ